MNRKIVLILIFLSIFAALSSGIIIYEAVTWNSRDSDNESVKLSAPEVVLDGCRAYWDSVNNAEKYEVSLNGELSYIDKTITEITLKDGQSLKIRAIGNETVYLTSEWSNTVTYNAPIIQKLPTPVVSINTDGIAVWAAVNGAVGYVYKFDDEAEYFTRSTSVQLLSNQAICVKAIGDGINNLDSDYSERDTYVPPEPQKLATPKLNISKNGIASWDAVEGADAYVYIINGSLENTTESTQIQLSSGMRVRVRAVSYSDAYVDSDFSEEKSYTEVSPDPEPAPDPNPEPEPEPNPEPEPEPKPTPPKLPTPILTVSDDGLAAWTEVVGAVKYVYRINGGEETETTSTSVQLLYCQKITVKACGDGENYTDSDYSSELTYIPPSPDFLKFEISEKIPSESDAFSLPKASDYAEDDYVKLLKKHFEDAENYLGNEYPMQSGYSFYAKPYDTVYLSVWLDNPRQYEILSIKFNGVKYVSGTSLFAFNTEKDGKIYTCVYTQVTLPGEAYEEFTYTVSEIEYIENVCVENTKLENCNYLKIGLPYEENSYAISAFNFENLNASSIDYKFTILGSEKLLEKMGGWLGLLLYRGSEIAYNGSLMLGENSVSVSGLIENTEYTSVIYLYADLHDGRGVTAHMLYYSSIITESAIELVKLDVGMKYDSEEKRYYPEISVKTVLNNESTQYIKLELYDKDGNLFYTDFNFDGEALISDGILNGADTKVKIYYAADEYPQGRSIEKAIYVYALGEISLYDSSYYSTVDSVIYRFRLGNESGSYPYVKGFRFLLYDKSAPAYIADSILSIMDNSNAIDNANSKYWEAFYELERVDKYLYPDEYSRLEKIVNAYKADWMELKTAKEIFDEYYFDKTDRAFWESERQKGKYLYEIVYSGDDTESVSAVLDEYYVALADYYSLYTDKDFFIKVIATLDKNDGEAAYEFDFGEVEASFSRPEFSSQPTYPKELSYENGKITVALSNGDDSPYSTLKAGYIYKIVMTKGEDDIVIYTAENPTLVINDSEWISEYMLLVKNGGSDDDFKVLLLKHVGEYSDFERFIIDESDFNFGEWKLSVYTRLYGKEYHAEQYEKSASITVVINRKLPLPTVKFEGQYAVFTIPEDLCFDGEYAVEIKDKDGNVTSTTVKENRIFVPVGSSLRVKANGYGYYKDSDWSEWVTLSGEDVEFPWVDFGN